MAQRPAGFGGVKTLEDVMAAWRADAATLKRLGHAHEADLIERVLKDVEAAAEEYMTWLTESDARLRSGKSERWIRQLWRQLKPLGHAHTDREGRRRLRMLMVPR
jgi:hypothetical protein